jgi:hypothetical protein
MNSSKGRKGDEPPRVQVVDTKLQRLRRQSAEWRAAMAGAGLAVAPEPRGETAASGGAAASAAHWWFVDESDSSEDDALAEAPAAGAPETAGGWQATGAGDETCPFSTGGGTRRIQ